MTGLAVDVMGDANNGECDTVTGLTVDVEGDATGNVTQLQVLQ